MISASHLQPDSVTIHAYHFRKFWNPVKRNKTYAAYKGSDTLSYRVRIFLDLNYFGSNGSHFRKLTRESWLRPFS